MKMNKRVSALLFAGIISLNLTATTVIPVRANDLIIVTDVISKDARDMANILNDFNSLLSEMVGGNQYPIELLGPLVAYAIILEDMELRFNEGKLSSPPLSSQYDAFGRMYSEAIKHVASTEGAPNFTDSSPSSVIVSAIKSLTTHHTNIITRIKTFVEMEENSDGKIGTEMFVYLSNSSKHIYDTFNSLQYIYMYNKQYASKSYISDEDIVNISQAMDTLYETYALMNQTFGKMSKEDRITIEISEGIKSLTLDDTGDLHPFYLNGIALSSTFIPFLTNLQNVNIYAPFLSQVSGASHQEIMKYINTRKPLYAVTGKNAVKTVMSGQNFSGKPIRLKDFIAQFNSPDGEIVLAVRKNSIMDKTYSSTDLTMQNESSSGTTPNQSETTEGAEINSSTSIGSVAKSRTKELLYDNNPHGYTEPVYIAGLVKDGEISSRNNLLVDSSVDSISRDRHNTRVANFNFSIMYNLVNNVTMGQALTEDMDKPISIDMFGNIQTDSGIVILPAIANANYYSNSIDTYRGQLDPANTFKNHMFPENATLKMAYPSIDFFDGQMTAVKPEFANNFAFATNYNCIENTSKMEHMNYMVKFLADSDLKVRNKGWFNWDKTLTTKSTLHYPSFPIYPYLIGDNVNKEDSQTFIINKSSFNALHTKNWLLAQRVDANQQYVLNIGNIVVSGGSDNTKYYNTSGVGFTKAVNDSIYNLNKLYLIFDKETKAIPSSASMKHNGTLNTGLLSELSQQVVKGSVDVMQMLMGEELTVLNLARGDRGFTTAIISAWCESLHFSLTNSDHVGSLMHTPKLDELPLLDRFMGIIKPLLYLLSVLGVFALLLSWRPFNIIPSFMSLGIKSGLYLTLLLIVFKFMPFFVDSVINYPVRLLYQNTTIENAVIDLEVKERFINTHYFEGFGEINTSQEGAYVVLADLPMKQYKFIHEMVNGSSFYKDFGMISYFDKSSTFKISPTMFMKGNQLCMYVDDLFMSSSIKSFDTVRMGDVNTREFVTPVLRQFWYEPSEIHYFSPYHVMIEHMLYVLNTLTTEVNARVSPLEYGNAFKITGFVRNYMKSNFYLKTPSERMQILEDIAKALSESQKVANGESALPEDMFITRPEKFHEIIRKLTTLNQSIGLNQDFLGIMKFSGIHTSAETERPFGKDVYDDVELINATLGEGLLSENNTGEITTSVELPDKLSSITQANWYRNSFFDKARIQLERVYNLKTPTHDNINVFINGTPMRDQLSPVVVEEGIVYINPYDLTRNVRDLGFSTPEYGYAMLHSRKISVLLDYENKVAGQGIRAYSNGAYVGFVDYIEKDGVILLALNGTNGIATTLNADFYWNSEYLSAMLFFDGMGYHGDLGEMYSRVLKVNKATRNYMDNIYSTTHHISDENLIKGIALNASINFSRQFSTNAYPIYPKNIEMNSINFDIYMKQLFIPDVLLARSAEAHSLYNYTAKTAGVGGVILLAVFEVLLVICIGLRDFLIGFHTVSLPLLYLMYYVFSTKFFYRPWLGTLQCFIIVTVTNFLMAIVMLIPKSMTANENSSPFWAILVAILIVVATGTVYSILWVSIYKDIRNLGYTTVKGILQGGLQKLSGKIKTSKLPDSVKSVLDSDVISNRLSEGVGSTLSALSSVERYQRDLGESSRIVSSNLDLQASTTVASEVKSTLATDKENIALENVSQKIANIQPVDYSELTKQGSFVTRDTLNAINKTTPLKHGKDYELLGDNAFITNTDVLDSHALPKSYLVRASATKDNIRELKREGVTYDRNGDVVSYVSSSPKGIVSNGTSYSDNMLTVPRDATKTVKEYLKRSKVEYTQKGNKFAIHNPERFTDVHQQEVKKLSKPLRVTTKEESNYDNGYKVGESTTIVSPDTARKDIRNLDKELSKIESRTSKRNVGTINSKKVSKLFKADETVHTYSLNIGDNPKLAPIVKDLYSMAQSIESTVSGARSTTLRTSKGISTVFESEEDYARFQREFTKATSDLFVRPTVLETGNNISLYTLKDGKINCEEMTKEEFKNSGYSLQDCRRLNK